jgi:hypothetical protein
MDLFCTFFNRSARFHFFPDPCHPSVLVSPSLVVGISISSYTAETSECAALRGEVEIHRVKRYYMELYKYRMSVTPDMLTEEARRASTLI